MDDTTLRRRLDAVRRRQRVIIALLVGPYLAGALLVVRDGVGDREVLAALGATAAVVVGAYLVALYRGRTAGG